MWYAKRRGRRALQALATLVAHRSAFADLVSFGLAAQLLRGPVTVASLSACLYVRRGAVQCGAACERQRLGAATS